MKEKITGSLLWENAMRAGLVLGGISVAYELLSMLPGLTGGFVGAVLGGILFLVRLAKIVLIVLLLKRMMVTLADQYDGVTRREARRFGMMTTLLSSVIVAAFSLISVTYLTPGLANDFAEAMRKSAESMQNLPEMQQQLEDQIAWFSSHFHTLVFAGTFLYCALWGLILSLIQSRRFDEPTPFDPQ